MTGEPETLLQAAKDMLRAIDRDYFMDDMLPISAFTQALREAVAREEVFTREIHRCRDEVGTNDG